MPPVSIDIALRCSAEIGLSEFHRVIAAYSKKDQKAGGRGISIALTIHSLDSTLQGSFDPPECINRCNRFLLTCRSAGAGSRDLEIAPTNGVGSRDLEIAGFSIAFAIKISIALTVRSVDLA